MKCILKIFCIPEAKRGMQHMV